MIFGSVCSGIEAASCAWHPLGWRAAFVSDIEKFPSAVLAHHYPDVPNLGDMTKFKEWPDYAIDLLVGGTPCQSFSVAGLRKGLADPRGNLMLTYLAIADRYRPRWLLWENVPGVLSSNGGRDFGSFLGGLAQLGYGFAYRVLDAQYFGVPQRRRRVFVVGYLGDWRRAAAVLFERHSLQGHPAPRREAGEGFAAPTAPSLTASGRGVERTGESRGQDPVIAMCLNAGGQTLAFYSITPSNSNKDYNARLTDKAQAVTAGGNRPSARGGDVIAIQERAIAENPTSGPDGIGVRTDGLAYTLEARTVPQAIAFSSKDYGADAGAIAPTLRSMGHDGSHANAGRQVAVAFDMRGREGGSQFEGPHDTANIRAADGGSSRSYVAASAVRRLTPRECERLQGFPDDYTLIPYRGKPAADGPRYKALGNSMAVPVMRWIGERIAEVDKIISPPIKYPVDKPT